MEESSADLVPGRPPPGAQARDHRIRWRRRWPAVPASASSAPTPGAGAVAAGEPVTMRLSIDHAPVER